MKKLYDDDEEDGYKDIDKAKILVTVIPFVLIIIILAITLLMNSCNDNKAIEGNEDLQESIMDYADSKLPKENTEPADTPTIKEPVAEKEETKTPEPAVTPCVTPTPFVEVMEPAKDYSKIEYEIEPQLKEMMSYWAENHQKALDDLVNLDHYKAMSWSLKGTEKFYYYGDVNANGQPHGVGIAVYADNRYYYGDWQNGLRNGNGTWMHYHIHEKTNKTDLYTYHQYTGGWRNDLPEGEGSEHYDYQTDLFKGNTGYITNLIGSYKNGLVNGEFYLTNVYRDGNEKEWYAEASMGSWITKSNKPDREGRYPVYVEDRNEDNYIWMHPKDNQNIGVPCLNNQSKN